MTSTHHDAAAPAAHHHGDGGAAHAVDDGEAHLSDTVSPAFLFSIFINQFFMAMTTLAPKTLSVFQVRMFFPNSGARVGPATGALSAAFAAAQLSTGFFWGWMSDYTGRPKMLILIANIVCGAGATWFALATTYTQALAARVIAGSFMASGVVLKAALGQVLTKNAQAVAMASRTLGAGVGQIVTPLIIGQLAHPCARWHLGGPACAKGGFLETHQFALSAAFVLCVGIVATASNFFIFPDIRVPEHLKKKNKKRLAVKGAPAAAARPPAANVPHSGSATGPAVTADPSATGPPVTTDPSATGPAVTADPSATGPPVTTDLSATGPAVTADPSATGPPVTTDPSAGRNMSPSFKRLDSKRTAQAARAGLAKWGYHGVAAADFEGHHDLDAGRVTAHHHREHLRARRRGKVEPEREGTLDLSKPAAKPPPPPPRPTTTTPSAAEAGAPPPPTPWYRHRPAVLSICAYAAVTWLFDAYLDLVNLFASGIYAPDTKGDHIPGLGWTVAHLSWIISLGGACIVAFSLVAYPPLQRRIGVSHCATFGLAAGIPTALLPPVARFPHSTVGVFAVMAVGQMAYGVAYAATSTSSQILTNLTAPCGQIGALNGAGNTLSALSRTLGPLVTGALWYGVAKLKLNGEYWIPFSVLSFFFGLVLVMYVASGLSEEDCHGKHDDDDGHHGKHDDDDGHHGKHDDDDGHHGKGGGGGSGDHGHRK